MNSEMDVANGRPKAGRRRRTSPVDETVVDRASLRDDLGLRLRAARERKNIGLRELARRLGVSASLISQIETGKSEPSINTLFAIVSELELSVNEIVFEPTHDGQPSTSGSDRAGDGTPGRHPRDPSPVPVADAPDSPVQRGTSRTSISLESGVSWERLTSQPDHNVDFLLLRYPPGSESTRRMMKLS